jgi:hypothetical protein
LNNIHRRRLERLARVSAYASTNAADFPLDTGKGGHAAADIKAILAEIETLETSRMSNQHSLRQATGGKLDARNSLRAQLRAISDTAKTIGLDHPEVKGAFKFKGASVSDAILLTTARAFALAVLPLKARFIEYDMPPDFLDKLNASIASFEQHLDRQTAGQGENINANVSIEAAFRRGDAALERLDTAVRNKYRDDHTKLAAWESARRLERAPHTKRSGGNSQTPPTHGDPDPAATK